MGTAQSRPKHCVVDPPADFCPPWKRIADGVDTVAQAALFSKLSYVEIFNIICMLAAVIMLGIGLTYKRKMWKREYQEQGVLLKG
ncbi:hypothetical protein K504DRAFT_463721 [Pleomassaria siparia CBS 279.74]|uniref:Uncharacterized protein n=1 Tax=Pleomassaria siparia CBS 279.74 TaxID=1314801 RepID=A0A6G1JS08_9PLEO|nr:hypothetical protein K504DRAFT_463721 [Pleomassaria siparia CBS 279.74]